VPSPQLVFLALIKPFSQNGMQVGGESLLYSFPLLLNGASTNYPMFKQRSVLKLFVCNYFVSTKVLLVADSIMFLKRSYVLYSFYHCNGHIMS
jgi:hypothetical protein